MALRNTNYNKVITRNYTNDANVQLTSVPESGFDMGYGIKSGGHIIGRLYALSRQKIMPHDTCNGGLSGSIQFNDFATPIVPDMAVHAYQYYLSDRAINKDFDYLMSPSKLNNYSQNASLPMFTPSVLLGQFLQYYSPSGLNTYQKTFALLSAYNAQTSSAATSAISTLGITNDSTLNSFIGGFAPTATSMVNLQNSCKMTYCDDTIYMHIVDSFNSMNQWTSYSQITASPLAFINSVFAAWYRILQPFFGKTSYMDMLGYPCINPRYIRERATVGTPSSWSQLAAWLFYGKTSGKEIPCNEHALRKQFAFWLEFMRNTQLEPNKAIFNYRQWGSASLLTLSGSITNDAIPIGLLAARSVPFEEDLLTSMHIDDICMHAFAPIMSTSDDESNPKPVKINPSVPTIPASTANGVTDDLRSTMQSVTFNYYDSAAAHDLSIETFLPSNVGRFMSDVYNSGVASPESLRLDLHILRQSKQMEKFLKIKYYFSDEYKDELSAIYMVDLKDAELFRPRLLSGDTNLIGVNETLSPLGVDANGNQQNNVRGSVGNSDFPNLHYNDFFEEYGDIITVFYVSIKPQYDPVHRYNLWKRYQDFPNPVFAQNNETISYSYDLGRCFLLDPTPFGHAPFHFDMRSRVDEIHGDFLDEKYYWQCPRTWLNESGKIPALNYSWLHMSNLKLGFMRNSVLTDGQYYFLAHDDMLVQRLLPAPIETL